MGGVRVRLLAEAADEARAARVWYSDRNVDVAAKFVAALDEAIVQIGEAPTRWPMHLRGTRRFRVRRFPYLVVYRVDDDGVEVIAFQHARRRPGYWVDRLA